MLVICRRKASTTSWETFSSMGRSKSSMDISNITESNITDTYVTDSMIIDILFYRRQNLIATQSLLITGPMIIIPMILLQKDLLIIIIIIIIVLLRQLGAVWPQSWPTIPRSKSRFVAFLDQAFHDPVGLDVTDISSLWPIARYCGFRFIEYNLFRKCFEWDPKIIMIIIFMFN